MRFHIGVSANTVVHAVREGQDPPLQSRNRCVAIRRGRRPRRPVCTKQSFFGGSKPLPYKYERTSLESVGAIINRPCSRSCVLTLGFGEKIQSCKSVILSERSESKDLGSIGNAKILRLPLVAQDDMF